MFNANQRYYIVFIVCNCTNGLFFWAFLHETKGLTLEEMDALFTESSIFVPGHKWESHHELERRREMVREGLGKRGLDEQEGVVGARPKAE